MSNLLDYITSLLGNHTATLSDSLSEPAQITNSKVLLLVYNPVMPSGKKLSEELNWHRVEDLITGFMIDLIQTSGGKVRYQIVQRMDLNEFPAKKDGFRYTPQAYLDVLHGTASPHMPQEADYNSILNQFNVLKRVNRNEIDEVWIFAFPHAGFYESTMAGQGAFWCNSQPLTDTNSSARRFLIMGFSFERGVGEMHESFGHRSESIMEKTFSGLTGDANLWQRFIRFDKVAPGKAACGNVHFAPNSQQDYDWNNPTPVKSECYDWLLNFPNFTGDVRTVGPSEWGSGEIRAHHVWWFNHFPKVAGRKNGIHNNWWQYIANPNNVRV